MSKTFELHFPPVVRPVGEAFRLTPPRTGITEHEDAAADQPCGMFDQQFQMFGHGPVEAVAYDADRGRNISDSSGKRLSVNGGFNGGGNGAVNRDEHDLSHDRIQTGGGGSVWMRF